MPLKMDNSKWYSIIYNSFLVVGIIIIISTIGSNSASSLTGTIVGYSFVVIGTLLLTGYLLNKMNATSGSTFSLINGLVSIGPFVALIGILVYMIYIISYYFSQITEGHVSSGYYNFMNVFVILLALQFYIFYNSIREAEFETRGTIGKVTGMTLYLLELCSIVTAITLNVILKHFSTDG